MARNTQKPLGINVLEAARKRIHHVFDTFDTVVVAFSGGKDSLVCIHLVQEVMQERGIKSPMKVFFKDQELIPDDVINFVDEYRQKPWIDLDWYCVPLNCTKYILGRVFDYVQWDDSRNHVRPMPSHSIKDRSGQVYDRGDFHNLVASKHRGRLGIITGIRASESIMRLRSVLTKVGKECYITTPKGGAPSRMKMAKVIYDWSENDVFKYFQDNKIRYCEIYDIQNLVGRELRVASSLQSEAAKDFHFLRSSHPEYYQRVVKLFPEMMVQERYHKQIDLNKLVTDYGCSFDGMLEYINQNITEPTQHKLAMKRFKELKGYNSKHPAAYPVDYVFKYIIRGGFRKNLIPASTGRNND